MNETRSSGMCNLLLWIEAAGGLLGMLGCAGSETDQGSIGAGTSALGGSTVAANRTVASGGAIGQRSTTRNATNGGAQAQSAQGDGSRVPGGASSSERIGTGGATANIQSGAPTTFAMSSAGGNAATSGGMSSSSGENAIGGTKAAGGSAATTSAKAAGGSNATGRTEGAGASGATGGTKAIGGTSASGGSLDAGGTRSTSGGSAQGGTLGGGSNASDDRCDVGVYDSASPPKALALGGTLGTHDPSAIESDGTFYLFATGLGAKTSTNLTTWRDASKPFAAPTWATTSVPGVTDLWAPDISYFGGKFHLYYSASTFGSNRSCIGQATRSALGSGTWEDQGAVICSNVNSSDNWNAIDPNVILDTAGKPWLVFGSFWSGIKIIQLDEGGARVGSTVTAIADRPKNGGALEGPFMVRRCGYYYLFTSWDTCCKGASSTYNVRVGRSTSVTGPFVDKAGTALLQGGGTLVAESGGSWVGPGGQSVLFTGKKAYLVYHAYASSNGAATLRIAELVWDASAWPVPVGP